MPAELYYTSTYAADANATNTLTVLGETSTGLTADQEIVVHVPASALKDALKFDPSWVKPANNVLDAETLPTVTWDPKKLADAMATTDGKTAEDRFLAKYKDQGKDAVFDDDEANSLDTMQKWIAYVPPPANSDIEKIPFEAIIKVVPGAVTAGKLGDSARLGNTTPVETSDHASNVMALFEQALAAGRASEEANGNDGTGGGSAGVDAGKLSFVNGDSITVYVTYSLSKTVQVEVDSTTIAGDAQYKIPGGPLIDPASTQGDYPLSETTSQDAKDNDARCTKVVAYKFLAATF